MHDNRTHPLLQQIPLTVSPFVKLPTATTLPYQYKPMPSTLPPSSITSAPSLAGADDPTASATSSSDHHRGTAAGPAHKPKYVISASGHAAHPDEILASCRALHAHVAQLQAQAEKDLAVFAERIRARDLAEKRRLAPGWLDSEARLLEPERAGSAGSAGSTAGTGAEAGQQREGVLEQPVAGFGGEEVGSGGGYGNGYSHGHGYGGASEMAVPDEGEQLDRVFGGLQLGRS
ncbi:hypothetical protein N658DRAFT_517267 [Parathielavia hyrcaniae]|uniref:Uncharacterized protein n=1 Tax=Parathielavia hyrcaniae TaxID=113614 RepID=A0AAN6T0I1_9PEZI|nr:hypothetical protein N658DRAFT_517267 [Parathielavia hyrcaniae]